MALRNKDGEPLETEHDWLTFFQEVMKFPKKSSTQYAKYLFSERFTGDVLADCIDDDDMKSLLKMPTGHFKKLKYYIKPNNTNNLAKNQVYTNESVAKIPCPTIHMDSTEAQFEQFIFEWTKFKTHYGLSGEQAVTTLFFSCNEEIRQHIRARQLQGSQADT